MSPNSAGKPDVSVVIPVYNAGPLLRLTLDSVLAQTGVTVEVILIDDGSTDETPRIFREYGDRISAWTIPNSGGPSIPRNEGVARAEADLIAFFDADDIMLPGKLARAVAAMGQYPQAGLFCTEFEGIDAVGAVFRPRWLAEYRDFRRDLVPAPDTPALGLLAAELSFRHLLRANFVGTSSVVCRREALAEVGLFNPAFKNSDDRDMWYRLARGGWDFLFLDEVCHSYRKAGGGVSARGGRRNKAIIESLSAQLDHVADPADRAFVRNRLRRLWLGYGYWLRKTGKRGPARAAYAQAWQLGPGWKSAAGWLRSSLGI